MQAVFSGGIILLCLRTIFLAGGQEYQRRNQADREVLHERKELIDQAGKYRKYRPTYKAYMQTKPKKQNAWKAEIADMSKKKRRLCGDLQTLRAEVQEAEAVKKCVEQAIQLYS